MPPSDTCNGRTAMIRPFLSLSAVLFLAPVATSNPQNILQQSASDADRQPQKTESQVLARTIYLRDCAMCHGNDGSGQTDLARNMHLILPDLTDQKALANTPDKDLLRVIRSGKGQMPPEDGSRAKDEDVKNLITYIRSFSKVQAFVMSNPGK
jgi:mono/diheme cytochrome c family protein